jgi:hypothetical protein
MPRSPAGNPAAAPVTPRVDVRGAMRSILQPDGGVTRGAIAIRIGATAGRVGSRMILGRRCGIGRW